MKKLLVAAAVAATTAVLPAPALAGSYGGVVVGRSAGSIAVASKGGVVRTVHTRSSAGIGARVVVNGAAVRVVGSAHRARIHAVVVRRLGGTTFLAAGRSLLAVQSSARRFASIDHGGGPAPGAVVNTTVGIANGQMTAQSTQVVGQTGSVTIQAPVTAVAAGSITVTVNGQSLTISLPAGLQLPSSLVGQSVTLTVKLSGGNPVAEPGDDDQGENENDDNDDDGGGGQGGGDDGD